VTYEEAKKQLAGFGDILETFERLERSANAYKGERDAAIDREVKAEALAQENAKSSAQWREHADELARKIDSAKADALGWKDKAETAETLYAETGGWQQRYYDEVNARGRAETERAAAVERARVLEGNISAAREEIEAVTCRQCDDVIRQIDRITKERDEARATAARLQGIIDKMAAAKVKEPAPDVASLRAHVDDIDTRVKRIEEWHVANFDRRLGELEKKP
jgi:chromosome segregation ATPase